MRKEIKVKWLNELQLPSYLFLFYCVLPQAMGLSLFSFTISFMAHSLWTGEHNIKEKYKEVVPVTLI